MSVVRWRCGHLHAPAASGRLRKPCSTAAAAAPAVKCRIVLRGISRAQICNKTSTIAVADSPNKVVVANVWEGARDAVLARISSRCRLDAEHPCNFDRPARCLSIEAANSAAEPGPRPCRGQPRMDRGIVVSGFDVGCDALAQRLRHVARAENADKSIKGQVGVTVDDSRHVKRARSARFGVAMTLTLPAPAPDDRVPPSRDGHGH